MAEPNAKPPNANVYTSSETTSKKKISWDSKSHEEGVSNIAKYLFGINEKETEDGFTEIDFIDNFEDGEIKVFMKVLKKLVEYGETLKIQNQNLIKEGVIVQSEEKTNSLNSGLTHLNKHIYPAFSKKYSEWIVRKRTDERINKMLAENAVLKQKLLKKKRNNEEESYTSNDSDTKSSNSDNDKDHKSKKKCTKKL